MSSLPLKTDLRIRRYTVHLFTKDDEKKMPQTYIDYDITAQNSVPLKKLGYPQLQSLPFKDDNVTLAHTVHDYRPDRLNITLDGESLETLVHAKMGQDKISEENALLKVLQESTNDDVLSTRIAHVMNQNALGGVMGWDLMEQYGFIQSAITFKVIGADIVTQHAQSHPKLAEQEPFVAVKITGKTTGIASDAGYIITSDPDSEKNLVDHFMDVIIASKTQINPDAKGCYAPYILVERYQETTQLDDKEAIDCKLIEIPIKYLNSILNSIVENLKGICDTLSNLYCNESSSALVQQGHYRRAFLSKFGNSHILESKSTVIDGFEARIKDVLYPNPRYRYTFSVIGIFSWVREELRNNMLKENDEGYERIKKAKPKDGGEFEKRIIKLFAQVEKTYFGVDEPLQEDPKLTLKPMDAEWFNQEVKKQEVEKQKISAPKLI